MTKRIPFRNDVVGSFLRPAELKQARADYKCGKITKDDLTKIEDKLIIELIRKQQQNGLHAVTDGEFRRRWWHLDFIVALNGITKVSFGDIITFQDVEMKDAEGYYVSDKLSFNDRHPFLEHFKFLKQNASSSIAKQTIPGPNMIYLGGALLSKAYLQKPVYDNIEQLENDIVKVYQDAIQAFYDAGCRYLQFDDTAWGKLFDKDSLEQIESFGYSVDELINKCGDITERSLENKPNDMAITFHICRGNFKSSWIYEGNYNSIAKRLFAIENFDGFFLEYDNERSGGFEPLKYIKGQKAVLGLITSKDAKLEDKAYLIDRVKQAAKFVPLDQICISPQCGFASTEDGNTLTEEQQWAKVRLVNEVADLIDGIEL